MNNLMIEAADDCRHTDSCTIADTGNQAAIVACSGTRLL